MAYPIAEQDTYKERRRLGTIEDVRATNSNIPKLLKLLRDRKSLAQIYAEDGAIQTARCIETVDIPIIEETLQAVLA